MDLTTGQFFQSVLREIAYRASMGAAYKTWPDDYARKEIGEAWTDTESSMREARHRKVTIDQLVALPAAELHELGFRSWDGSITLIPLWVWNYIEDGEVLTCIDGGVKVKGEHEIDLDVRAGCIAYGFRAVQEARCAS